MAKIIVLLALALSNIFLSVNAGTFSQNTQYEVCFTPGNDCTMLIVNEINKSKKSIHVQAYSFTSAPIAKALSIAKKRGVDVSVILDKGQFKNNKYSSSKYFINQRVPLWIDYQPAIAHNKIIIVDDSTVITGSFNFTKAAQEKNAENVLIIHDAELANLYLDNWNKRARKSRFVN